MTEAPYEHRQFRCTTHDVTHAPGQRGTDCEGEWELRPGAEAAIDAAMADGSIWGGADAEPEPEPDPLEGLTLDQSVALTEAAAQKVSETATGTGVSGLAWEAAVKLLDRLREAAWLLGTVEAALVRHIYLTGEHGKSLVEGIGQVQVSRSRDRTKWDERGVARAVIDTRMEARGGEVPDDPWEVAEWLLEVYGINYCRVTPLRSLGLDPEAFCESSPGKPTVSLPPHR